MSALAGLRRSWFPAMGTRVEVTVDAGAPGEVEAAVRALFARREAALSRFRAGSELCALNRAAGTAHPVSPLLMEAVERAREAARSTEGLFDPTMGRQIAELGYDRTFTDLDDPGPLPIPAVRPGGGWRGIAVDREAGTVTIPTGVALDLGGIAKGMAVDAAIALLAEAGVMAALVNAGGDLAVLGRPEPGPGWEIAVRLPAERRRVVLRAGALATSGVERRRWGRGGVERHHLLDPRSGRPAPPGLWSVSAVAPTCEEAEVAATAAFVLGPRGAAPLLLARGLAGLVVPLAGAPVNVAPWPGRAAA